MQDKYGHIVGKNRYYHNNARLYVLMAYFHKGRLDRDIDNILKPAIDSFCHIVYRDDSQVRLCISQAVDCSDNTINEIPVDKLDEDCFSTLMRFLLTDDRDCTFLTYFECGEMNNNMYSFNLESK